MPCYDGRDKEEAGEVRAMLCGVLRALTRTGHREEVLAAFDEASAGITKAQLLAWATAHGAADRTGGRDAP